MTPLAISKGVPHVLSRVYRNLECARGGVHSRLDYKIIFYCISKCDLKVSLHPFVYTSRKKRLKTKLWFSGSWLRKLLNGANLSKNAVIYCGHVPHEFSTKTIIIRISPPRGEYGSRPRILGPWEPHLSARKRNYDLRETLTQSSCVCFYKYVFTISP